MGETTKLQVNFRAGQALINGYADTPEQLDQILAYLQGKVQDILDVQALFDAGNVVVQQAATPRPAQQQSGGWGGQAPAQAAAPAGPAPTCVHGERIYKEGTSRAGKPYKMWSCPSRDRNAQCEPQWIR